MGLDCGRSKANASASGWDETSTAFVRVTLWVTHPSQKARSRGSMRLTVRCSSDPAHQFAIDRLTRIEPIGPSLPICPPGHVCRTTMTIWKRTPGARGWMVERPHARQGPGYRVGTGV